MKRQLYSIGGGAIKGTDAGNGREGFFRPVPGSPTADLLNTLSPNDPRHYGIGFGPRPMPRPIQTQTQGLGIISGLGASPQGGEQAIYPRLGSLTSGVSAAEQELQQINQSIDQVQSTLGESSGGTGVMDAQDRTMPGKMDSLNRSLIGNGFYDFNAGLGQPLTQISSAMRSTFADGGMMGRQMYQRGGIMEVAPRQGALFGGLKKAVSSALGSAKKILKSPIGKAAALYFAPALIPGGAKTLGGVFQNMGGLSGITSSLFANPATYQQKLMGVEKGFFPGLMDKFSNMGKLGKMSTMFGIGTLGGGALAALDAAGAGETDIKDVEALKAYLKSGYLKLNPDKSEQDAEAFAEANTVEYRANGGRIGFADGMPKEKFLSFEEAKAMNPGMFSAEVETNVVSPNTELLSYIKRIKSAAEKGTIPMDFALDLIKQKTKEQGVNLQDLRDDMMERTKEAYGGRIMRAYGDVVDQASGIMGLPQRVNQAGVKELDLRDSGGFIPPVGVKEKADDIPAMLSNNEFVFTADAVRGMGNGNVNKGAQRMYDMMKKLENGGRV